MPDQIPWIVHQFAETSITGAESLARAAALIGAQNRPRQAVILPARTARKDFGSAVHWTSAHDIVVVESTAFGPAVDWARSRSNLKQVVAEDFTGVLVITGWTPSVGTDSSAVSPSEDFTAVTFAVLLAADEVVLWRDAAGVYSADPSRVPDAAVIDQLTYDEAAELAYFGASIIHPQALAPAMERRIPIRIRSALDANQRGTLICANAGSAHPVKGITSIDAVALVNLEGAGMIGVPGTAQRLFGALGDAGVSVILISQGSSEHSICCAVRETDAVRAAAVVEAAFECELREGQIQGVDVERGLAILAAVGDGMAGATGVAAKLFSALAAVGVNVRAIAQGSSERNISVVVDARNATRGLRAAHAGFYLSPHTFSVGVIGPGSVGSAFLDQLASQAARLREQFGVHLRVRGILASQRMALSDQGFGLDEWRGQLQGNSGPAEIDRFIDHVRAEHLPHAVIIDCSASEAVARRYADLFARGIHVVTPNKKAGSGKFSDYEALRHARRSSGAHFLYEATVGAGLPIIQTLRDLRETGDDILSIEGMFSGTLAYLFNTFDGAKSFSSVVSEARRLGYTEPDPRDDLSGLDVARKLIILGREMGLSIELADVSIQSLVPAQLTEMSVEEFLAQLPRHDDVMRSRFESARANGRVLRHVGRVSADGAASVGLVELDARHAFANVALTDNIVRFQTRRYNNNPLIVQGPGAGPEVTAGGVFADLLRLASYLGARI